MTGTTVYGLPRYVGTFLRQMEPHKDYLKWNITEGSHKITLTLSWNFHRHKHRNYKEKLWAKLQRTLKLTNSPDAFPKDLAYFLDNTSPRKEIKRQLSLSSPFRRDSGSPFRQRGEFSWNRQGRSSSFREHSTTNGYSPTRNAQISPSRYSWPGAALPLSGSDMDCHQMNSADNLLTVESSTFGQQVISPPQQDRSRSRSRSPARVRLSYRTEEDVHASWENIMEKTRQQTRAKLEAIRREWNNTMKHWPKFFFTRDKGTKSLDTSTEESEPDPSLLVQKCLVSCDKILSSTDPRPQEVGIT